MAAALNGDNQAAIAQAGAIRPLVELLKTGGESSKEVTAWALRNLAFDGENRPSLSRPASDHRGVVRPGVLPECVDGAFSGLPLNSFFMLLILCSH